MEWVSFIWTIFICHQKDPGLKSTFQEKKSLCAMERKGAVFLAVVISYRNFLTPCWGLMGTGSTQLQPTHGSRGLPTALLINTQPVRWPLLKSFTRVYPGPSHRSAVFCAWYWILCMVLNLLEIVFLIPGFHLACVLLPSLHPGNGQFHLWFW